MKILVVTFIICAAAGNPAKATQSFSILPMHRIISVCLIVAVAAPQLARGKCLCPVSLAESDLPPCCLGPAQKQAGSQYSCCACHRPNHGQLGRMADAREACAATISSDCECGRVRLLQLPWRWSPRRDVSPPRESEVLVGTGAELRWAAAALVRSDFAPQTILHATGPPLHVWNCVWLN